jgi:hypothetical protein
LPPPSFDDLRRFCAIDGWEELERVRGGTGDHRRYRKILRDGTILRTKASHGGGEIRDPGLWRHIWRDQLGLAGEAQFWQALRIGKAVARADAPAARPEGQSIPGWVVAGLLRAGVREDKIRELDAAAARTRLEEIWSHPPDTAE